MMKESNVRLINLFKVPQPGLTDFKGSIFNHCSKTDLRCRIVVFRFAVTENFMLAACYVTVVCNN